MKKLYATLFSALVVGCAVCAAVSYTHLTLPTIA